MDRDVLDVIEREIDREARVRRRPRWGSCQAHAATTPGHPPGHMLVLIAPGRPMPAAITLSPLAPVPRTGRPRAA